MAQRADRNPNLKLLGVLVSGLDKRIRKAREDDEVIRERALQPVDKLQRNSKQLFQEQQRFQERRIWKDRFSD